MSNIKNALADVFNMQHYRTIKLIIGLVATVWLLGIAVFYSTFQSMLTVWLSSDTYSHCFFVVPITIYLIWLKRDQALPDINVSPLFLVATIPVGLSWLVGNAAGVSIIEQYSMVGMIVVGIATLLGKELTKALLFPLLFMFLSVPVGEQLTPQLINFTADFVVAGLRFFDFPVYREGTFFSLPSGNWSVVEACSGVRYLIASVTIGLLFSYMMYQSIYRRLAFVGVSIIVPVIANGLRAIMIVLIGHYSSMKLATGVDHLIYGWLFFGLVMFILFWLGSFFSDIKVEKNEKCVESTLKSGGLQVSIKRQASYLAVIFIVMLSWASWGNSFLPVAGFSSITPEPLIIKGNYEACTDCSVFVKSAFIDPTYDVTVMVDDEDGSRYQVQLLAYHSLSPLGELINSQNRVVSREGHQKIISEAFLPVMNLQGKLFSAHVKTVSSDKKYRLWHFNMLNGDVISNKVKFKFTEAARKILGDAYLAVTIIVTSASENENTVTDEKITQLITKNIENFGVYINKLNQMTVAGQTESAR